MRVKTSGRGRRTPTSRAPAQQLPDRCQRQGNIAESIDSSGLVRRASFDCAGSAGGMTLSIDSPGANPSLSSLVRYLGASGEQVTEVLDPERCYRPSMWCACPSRR